MKIYILALLFSLFILGCGEEGSYIENSDGTFKIIDPAERPIFVTKEGLPPAPMPIDLY